MHNPDNKLYLRRAAAADTYIIPHWGRVPTQAKQFFYDELVTIDFCRNQSVTDSGHWTVHIPDGIMIMLKLKITVIFMTKPEVIMYVAS